MWDLHHIRALWCEAQHTPRKPEQMTHQTHSIAVIQISREFVVVMGIWEVYIGHVNCQIIQK